MQRRITRPQNDQVAVPAPFRMCRTRCVLPTTSSRSQKLRGLSSLSLAPMPVLQPPRIASESMAAVTSPSLSGSLRRMAPARAVISRHDGAIIQLGDSGGRREHGRKRQIVPTAPADPNSTLTRWCPISACRVSSQDIGGPLHLPDFAAPDRGSELGDVVALVEGGNNDRKDW